ncbi:hypothetical protein D3C80_1560020 [compost metagenome]
MQNRVVMVETRRKTLRTHEKGLPVPGEIRAKIHAHQFIGGKNLQLLAYGCSLHPGALVSQIKSVRVDPADCFERNERGALVPHLTNGAESGDMFAGVFGDGTFDRFHDRGKPCLLRDKPLALGDRQSA